MPDTVVLTHTTKKLAGGIYKFEFEGSTYFLETFPIAGRMSICRQPAYGDDSVDLPVCVWTELLEQVQSDRIVALKFVVDK